MADVNTDGGASVDGNVEAKGGFTGRDEIKQVVNIERDQLDDVRTDINFIKNDIINVKLAQYEMKAELKADINTLRHPTAAQATPMSPLQLIMFTVLIVLAAVILVVVIAFLARGAH